MTEMTKDLSEFVDGDVNEAIRTIAEHLKTAESDKLDAFTSTLKDISEETKASNQRVIDALEKNTAIMQKILERPDPKFPEIPPYPEQKEFPKFPEFPEQEKLSPLLEELIERIAVEHNTTRGVLMDILNKEPEPSMAEEIKKEGKFPLNIGSIRRRARWEISTYPNIAGTGSIVSKGDGFTFYLPFSPIKNSETVRLNGGLPMSQGVDYTLTGNALVFVQNQTGSQIEVRSQN